MCVKRAQPPQPESWSGANVWEVIRERVRTQRLWSMKPPTDKAGINEPGFFWLRRKRGFNKKQNETGANYQNREYKQKQAGKAMSSRRTFGSRTVIVP